MSQELLKLFSSNYRCAICNRQMPCAMHCTKITTKEDKLMSFYGDMQKNKNGCLTTFKGMEEAKRNNMLPEEINTPNVEQTIYGNLEFATEVAWAALVDRAIKDGLVSGDARPAGLEYTDDSKSKQQFKDACKAILVSLGAQIEKN